MTAICHGSRSGSENNFSGLKLKGSVIRIINVAESALISGVTPEEGRTAIRMIAGFYIIFTLPGCLIFYQAKQRGKKPPGQGASIQILKPLVRA